MYRVKKRDGSVQDFDGGKLGLIMGNTGLSDTDIQNVLDSIDSWLPTIAMDNIVDSMDIRAKLIEEVQKINTDAANKIRDYIK